MSVEIELRKTEVRPTDVSCLLKQWADENGIIGRLEDNRTDFARYFLPGRSIRGFSLTRRRVGLRTHIGLRLSLCASSGDWEAAFSFLRFGQDKGFGVRSEDGRALAYGDLSPEAAGERARERFAFDIRALQGMLLSEQEWSLPTSRFVVPVRRADIPEGQLDSKILESLQSEFLRRATKYDAARSASLITAGSGDTMIVWAGEAMLAPAADYVVLSPTEFDPDKSVVLAFHKLLERSPAGFEKIGEKPQMFYFPALPEDSEQWIELKRAGLPFEPGHFKKE